MARRNGLGRVLVAITCCLTALGAGTARAIAATSATATPIPPHAWIVADAGTGEVLESGNDHVALPPASTSKIMTALTAVERLPPDAMITVSALAASQPASKINMQPGQHWSFSDALASLLVVSANDAAYAIAEATSGSIAAFAKTEAVTGRQLGLKDSTFNDPAGLDDGNAYEGGPLMSAYDIAISTRNALRVPMLAHLAASPSVSFTGPDGIHHTLVNHNKLVSDHLYAGATGFKTGFTNKAEHTLVATATRNGRTLIAVILGTDDAYGWATRLLDAGFATAPGHGTGETLPPPRGDHLRVAPHRAHRVPRPRRCARRRPPARTARRPARPRPVRPPRGCSAAGTVAAAVASPSGLAAGATAKGHGGGLSTTTILS